MYFKSKKTGRFYIAISILLFLIILDVSASSTLTPRLALSETFINNQSGSLDQNGSITTISPGIQYTNTQRRSELLIDYSLNLESRQKLNSGDTENQNLKLSYGLTHIPNQWSTTVFGNIQQTTTSAEGIQSFDPALNFNNTSELRTYGVNSALNGKLFPSVAYQSSISADYAGYEDSESSQSVGLNLSLDNSLNRQKLYWNGGVNSRQTTQSGETGDTISTYNVGMNYRFNHQYTAYIQNQGYDTSNDQLNDSSTLIGVKWKPNKNSFLEIGAGKRGDDSSYLLNSNFTKRRLVLSMNYNEEITTARSDVLQQVTSDQGLVTTYQSLSTIPILQKQGNIRLTYKGNYTDVSFSYLEQTRDSVQANTNKEKTKTSAINLSRKLSRKSSISASLQNQESETVEKNKLSDFNIMYARQLSKNMDFNARVSHSKQDSNDTENEYSRNILGFSISATF